MVPPQTVADNPIVPRASEDPEPFSFGNCPDPNEEEACKVETGTSLLHLKALLKEKKYEVRKLEEEIYMREIVLGTADVPGHNLFDEVLPISYASGEDSGSPGAATLVEADPDLETQLPVSEGYMKPSLSDSLDTSKPKPDNDDDNYVFMDVPIAYQPDEKDPPTFPDLKKRKRFSKTSASKKVRIEVKSPRSNKSLLNLHFPTANTGSYNDRIDGIPDSAGQIDDGTKPSPTTRPISWPRSRLFRRSAGVSVRKLTEVFEKICLPQDKP